MKNKFLSLCAEKFGYNHEGCFEKTNYRGHYSVSFYKNYCCFTFVEKGGLKEGYEQFELKFNKKDLESLRVYLKPL